MSFAQPSKQNLDLDYDKVVFVVKIFQANGTFDIDFYCDK